VARGFCAGMGFGSYCDVFADVPAGRWAYDPAGDGCDRDLLAGRAGRRHERS
jgi:hypothetical protein